MSLNIHKYVNLNNSPSRKKMAEAYLVELTICHFKDQQTEAVYTCFKNELCCDEGCCPKTNFNVFRIWYFWLTVIALLFVFSGGCKYCRFKSRQRRESARERRVRNGARFVTSPSPPSDLSAMRSLEMYYCNPRRNELDELINLRRLLAEQEACNVAIDRYVACQNARTREQLNTIEPPSYNSLQGKTNQVNPGDPPPNYNTVCKDCTGNATQSNVDPNQNSEVVLPRAHESTRSDLPTTHTQLNAVQNDNEVTSQENMENA